MLHVRVTCPAGATDDLVTTIAGADGTASITVVRGAVVDDGSGVSDVVEVDVVRGGADRLLTLLERGGAHDQGSVSVAELGMADGRAIARAHEEAPGQGVDAVVWSQLVETTDSDSVLSSTYLVFLVVATLIAAVGLLTDSQVLIVGAMVLGPDFTATAALAVSVVDRDARRALRSGRTVVVGFALAIAATAGAVALLQALGQVPGGYLDGERPLTLFITTPNGFSVAVALLAGVAGTVSLTAAKSSSLVGVFISVTTVPAAAEIAAAAVTGQDGKAGAAAAMLGINVAAIVVAATATLLVQRAVWARLEARRGESHPQETSADTVGTGAERGSRGSPGAHHPATRPGAPEPWQHLGRARAQVRAGKTAQTEETRRRG